MNEHPSEEYIRQIKGLKILINEDLNDDEIMVSPRVYKKMKESVMERPTGYSPKVDKEKLLDEVKKADTSTYVPTWDMTPLPIPFTPPIINISAPEPIPEDIFKEAIKPLRKERYR